MCGLFTELPFDRDVASCFRVRRWTAQTMFVRWNLWPTVVNVPVTVSHIKNNLKLNIVLSTPAPIMRSGELQLPMSLFNNAFKFSPKFVNNSSHIRSSFGVTLFLSIGTTRRYLTAMQ